MGMRPGGARPDRRQACKPTGSAVHREIWRGGAVPMVSAATAARSGGAALASYHFALAWHDRLGGGEEVVAELLLRRRRPVSGCRNIRDLWSGSSGAPFLLAVLLQRARPRKEQEVADVGSDGDGEGFAVVVEGSFGWFCRAGAMALGMGGVGRGGHGVGERGDLQVYPLFAAVGVAIGMCGFQLVRNLCINPEVRASKLTEDKEEPEAVGSASEAVSGKNTRNGAEATFSAAHEKIFKRCEQGSAWEGYLDSSSHDCSKVSRMSH